VGSGVADDDGHRARGLVGQEAGGELHLTSTLLGEAFEGVDDEVDEGLEDALVLELAGGEVGLQVPGDADVL